jgi:hypothetical protein
MKVRTLVTGAVALALAGAGALAPSARADDLVDADVGGGVAALQAAVEIGAPTILQPLKNEDYARYTVVYGRAVLGTNGGSREASAVNKAIGPVSIKAAYNKISGNRRGTPFATAQSTLLGVDINGTKLGTLDVSCTWDYAGGSRGTTVVTDVNGNKTTPEPSSTTEIPGLGKLVLNEQFIQNGEYVYDSRLDPSFPYTFQEQIFVYGAHLRLDAAAADLYGTTDIILGFTSCDPVKLPSLSGLKLGSNAT